MLEELYDVQNDPDCLVNLIDSPATQETVMSLRNQLTSSLKQMDDPVALVLQSHPDASIRDAYMANEDKLTNQSRGKRKSQPAKPK